MPIPKKRKLEKKYQKQQDKFKKNLLERFETELQRYDKQPIVFCFSQAVALESIIEIVAQVAEKGWDIQFRHLKLSGWEFTIL